MKLAIATYSYWHFRTERVPIETVIDKAAVIGVEGVDILHRQMDIPEKEPLTSAHRGYLQKLKRHAFRNGVLYGTSYVPAGDEGSLHTYTAREGHILFGLRHTGAGNGFFAGEITHRDSTGVEQAIRPGEMNWMTAGRGITHSERFERARREGGPLHGIQSWVALPESDLLAHLSGMEAALLLHTDTMQDLTLIEGEGGPGQTAFGVVADLVTIAGDVRKGS